MLGLWQLSLFWLLTREEDDPPLSKDGVSAEEAAEDTRLRELADRNVDRASSKAQVDCRMELKREATYGIDIGMWVSDRMPVLIADAEVNNAWGNVRDVRAYCVFEGSVNH